MTLGIVITTIKTWNTPKQFVFLDSADFECLAFSVESVICHLVSSSPLSRLGLHQSNLCFWIWQILSV